MFELFFILTLAQFQVQTGEKKPNAGSNFGESRNVIPPTSTHSLERHSFVRNKVLNEPSLSRNV